MYTYICIYYIYIQIPDRHAGACVYFRLHFSLAAQDVRAARARAPGATPTARNRAPRRSVIRWAFEGLCVNEFKGLEFDAEPGRPRSAQALSGDDALARVAFEGSTVRTATLAQSAILGGCYAQTYRILRNKTPRYAKLRAPVS